MAEGSDVRPSIPIRIAAIVVMAVMLLPIAVVIFASFLDDTFIRIPAVNGYTVRWYQHFWSTAHLGPSLLTSLRIGVIATAISLVLGLGAALAFGQIRSSRMRAVFNVLFILPLLIPHVVSAPAIYVIAFMLQQDTGASITTSPALLVAGHVTLTLPWSYRLISVGLSPELRTLERASLTLGMARWSTIRRITLPLLRPHMFGAAIFAFLFSFTNLEMSLFLTSPGEQTLPVSLLQYAYFKVDPTLASASVVEMFMVAVLMVCAVRIVGYGSVVKR
jgi:putative spermidine/putrescine transport system permease protein